MTQGHSERAHAELSASGADRWISCPGSVRLERGRGESSSSYADEGTAAHELSEIILRRYIGEMSTTMYHLNLRGFRAGNQYYSKEMEDYVNNYTDAVIERINAAGPGATVLLEERLDYSEWVPDGYGTGDVLIISDKVLEIIDLKYGAGVPVSAVNNKQLRMYGIGALNMFGMLYDIETVRMTIVQPRLDSITSDEISVTDLIKWAEDTVRPAAALALTDDAPTCAGDWCKWCKVKAECKTRSELYTDLVAYEYRDQALMDETEIAHVLSKVDGLVKWANDVKDHAYKQALSGVKLPGFKLVEGKSNRVIRDKQKAAERLDGIGKEVEEFTTPGALKGIGDLEKLLGKKLFEGLLGDLIIKPEPKPALVPESDKRPELSSGSEFEVIE